ncbi:MAG: hypothetical protein ACD_57C00004G0002 [uncultured bacterium]|uniref:NAD-dependent epimerase/dehydratase domain-containing protein n=1 Tax=Candidatus Curtissbacteria bacterium RIFOXYA1_FULL_41_14 TaxID=1797737 RepID=A0A1F5HA34_9BACT|nr:MAG: hypothetical protein ACD_57C00004G0002 [uncultured bacterium]KKR58116.1 MAG: hypothetical protein UT95_C0010G0002 [Candidatus Curtissbacteria bacterium GW2011_GWB1_40_28]KKR60426.1 MAG: hypothetical protein UT99_C0014G0013 [Candidatus Curtissbacteria bacterium GW2011_GWA2_40_31]KKR61770.1 MAG: hypothetical protein UU00_C0008G0043 [Microgenomates group bacterium GW2011_GWC1_40_35]KKR64840.1 MAG: hypothetical protein UU05_C0037G0006 [Candidatus Curtissbacteria bacterium GW2011_GWA1_40_47]
MEISAQNHQKKSILITHVDSFLGESLAAFLVSRGYQVWAVGNPPLSKDLLKDHNFTLLELDLSQPLPEYLPSFDLVFYLGLLRADFDLQQGFSYMMKSSPVTATIMSLAKEGKSKIIIFAPISKGEEFWEYLTQGQNLGGYLKLFLIGDVYGPGMLVRGVKKPRVLGILADLIHQAAVSDKVILEKEGLEMIYATYITDVLLAIRKFVFLEEHHDNKNVQVIISEGPKTVLTVAYEIQNIAGLVMGKELGLFFAGSQPLTRPEPEPTIAIHDLGFSPEVTLGEGLKNILEDYLREGASTTEKEHKPSTHLQSHNSVKEEISRIMASNTNESRGRLKRVTGRLTSKIGHFHFKPRIKSVILVIISVLILLSAKLALDVYFGANNLKNAQSALTDGDLYKAGEKAKKSAGAFKRAASETRILLYPLSPVLPKKIENIDEVLFGMSIGASSLDYLAAGSGKLLFDLAQVVKDEPRPDKFDLETPLADLQRARFLSSQAQEVLSKSLEGVVFKAKVTAARDAFSQVDRVCQTALELTNLISDLTGKGSAKTYLVLLQNSTELRPGGGFIGNFGLIEFDGGHLKNISVENIYTIDGQLQEKIEPPKELTQILGVDQFYLRDSNWSGDFTVNSATARDFYKKETGKDVDGVIAVNLNFIQNVLAKIGPIKLSDYNEEITDKNLFERGEYYSEVGSFAGSTQKKDFFGALTRSLISKILTNIEVLGEASAAGESKQKENVISLPTLLEVFREGFFQKDIMMTFDDPNLSSFVRTHSWDWPLPPVNFDPADDSFETRDFLALVEANLGANKVNRFLERKINYEVDIGRDADLVAKLTVVYTNTSQADTWPAGKYVNYLRVYVPFAASLFEFKNGDKNDPSAVEVSSQGNLTVFGTMVEVPVKSSREVTFSYRIPKNIKLEKAPYYHLYVQKQSGTEKDPVEFTFNLPSYLEVKSVNDSDEQEGKQNLSLKTDLSTDRQFEIEVVKR